MKPILIKLLNKDPYQKSELEPHDKEAWSSDHRFDLWCSLMKGFLFRPCGGYGGPKAIKPCIDVKIKKGQPKPLLMEIEYWDCSMGDERHIPDYWKDTRICCSLNCPYCNRVPEKTKEMINSMNKETK